MPICKVSAVLATCASPNQRPKSHPDPVNYILNYASHQYTLDRERPESNIYGICSFAIHSQSGCRSVWVVTV